MPEYAQSIGGSDRGFTDVLHMRKSLPLGTMQFFLSAFVEKLVTLRGTVTVFCCFLSSKLCLLRSVFCGSSCLY